jgi:hypothetical protein
VHLRLSTVFLVIAVSLAARAGETSPPETQLPGESTSALPLKLDLPELDAWIAKLEAIQLNGNDPAAAEELAALYILKGRREAGLRLLGQEDLPPLPIEGYRKPLPTANTTPATAVVPSLTPEEANIDPAVLGAELVKSDDAGKKTLGIYLLIMADKPAAAERALKDLPDKLPVRRWLNALLYARTGQPEKAVYEARLWADELDTSSPLKLQHLAFVDSKFPVSYGVYQELPGRSLSPGELALLYVEVPGAKSAEDKAGHTVRFSVDYSIAEDSGKTVWKKDKPDIVGHTTRVPTRDLFLTSAFYMPMGLAPGQYSLRLEVEDLVSGTKAMAATPFSLRER